MRLVIILTAMVLATAVMVIWLMSPMLPLGVPGEWGWPALTWTDAHSFAWISNLLLAGVIVGLVAFLARFLASSPEKASSWRRRGVISAIVGLLAAGWWIHLLGSVPAPFGLARSPFVLFYPRMTGYYTAARYSTEGTTTFLRGYERMLRDLKGTERYLHIGTHPPGLILMNRGFLGLTAAFPAIVSVMKSTMPELVRDANETISEESLASGREFTPRDAATLWLITLATIAAAAACIPLLAGLLHAVGHSEAAALRWSALWMFTPAVAVFLPKDDVLFAMPVLLAAWLWVKGLDRDSRVLEFMAGVVCFLGLFCSLAFSPVMLWLVIATLGAWWHESRAADPNAAKSVKPRAGALAAGLAGFLVPLGFFLVAFETNLATIWRVNFEHHAEFYQHNPRSYSKWLFANVGELMFAAGPAVFLLAIVSAVMQWRAPRSKWSMLGPAGLIVLAGLWLSGKNMGEAARLWILFLPWLFLCLPVRKADDAEDNAATGTGLVWWMAAGLEAIACIAAATQIDGFGFSQL